jgi:hypothetical protein
MDTQKMNNQQTNDQKMDDKKFRTEELQVKGEEIVTKVKELVHQGNIRHIVIKNEEGKTILEMPFILGMAGALLVPQLAAVGAVAALLSHASIVIEKTTEE